MPWKSWTVTIPTKELSQLVYDLEIAEIHAEGLEPATAAKFKAAIERLEDLKDVAVGTKIHCLQCDKIFKPGRKTQFFCSATCRQQYYASKRVTKQKEPA